jgi:hypothetical protein
MALCAAACAQGTVPLDPRRADGGAPDAAARDAAPAPDAQPTDAQPTDALAADADVALDAAPPDAARRPVGSPCERDEQCASASSPLSSLEPGPCLIGPGNPWPNGYCVDYCTLPADPLAGPALLRSDCPEGSVCVPRFDDPAQAPPPWRPDIGACFKECNADPDCRDEDPVVGFGYFCRKHFTPTSSSMPPFTNGYCAAPHCRSRGCPQSYVCGC